MRLSFALPGILWFAAGTGVADSAPQQGPLPASSGSAATAGISLTEVVADAQGSAVLEVDLVTAGQALSAIQFDISFQEQTLVFSVSPASGLTSAGKSIWVGNPQPGLERVLIIGLNQNTLMDGVLATLSADVTGGALPGVYPLALTSALASDPRGAPVPLSSSGGGVVISGSGVPAPVIGGVANGASYAAGPVAPGEIVIVAGNTLADAAPSSLQITPAGLVANSLADTRVLFDDIPAPLLYAAANQVSAVVPYEVSGGVQTSIQVEYQGVRSAPFTVPVTPTSPGIFTLSLQGTGQGAIVNQDGTVNGPDNPAARGDVVSIYGTGEGQTIPPGIDGIVVTATDLREPQQTVTASIGGQSAEVLYAGSAGGEVAGVLQVNACIPLEILSGAAVPVTIVIGGSSQAGVTMAVR